MRIGKLLLAAFTILMLMSLGGAQFYAAPFLMPALCFAFRSSGRWARAGFAFLAGVLGLETGWLVCYSTVGEQTVPMWIAMTLGFSVPILLFYLPLAKKLPDVRGRVL